MTAHTENQINNEDAVKKSTKHKKPIIVLSVILAFTITFVATLIIMIKTGENKLRNEEDAIRGTAVNQEDDETVYHNGKAYIYNDKLINILLLGVDKNSDSSKTQGQADALYLASINTDDSTVKVVSISRNTFCLTDVLDASGKSFGEQEQQICLAYAVGNNDVNASENCVRAASRLLYNIPINGYYTIFMDSVSDIVNSVGGVTVKIPSDTENPTFADRRGETVTLKGNEALVFLKMRGESNGPRMERQKEFMTSFLSSARQAVKKDIRLPFKTASKLADESVTSIAFDSVLYLATEGLNSSFSFVNIEGEYSIKDELEIFTPNEEQLRNLVINNFYIEK